MIHDILSFFITLAADDRLAQKNASTARTYISLDLQALFLRSPSVSPIFGWHLVIPGQRNEDIGDHMLGRCSRKRYLFQVGTKNSERKICAVDTMKDAERFLAAGE